MSLLDVLNSFGSSWVARRRESTGFAARDDDFVLRDVRGHAIPKGTLDTDANLWNISYYYNMIAYIML